MKFSVLSFQFVDDEPGMSFALGSDCPQASGTCCDTPSIFQKDILWLSFCLSLRGDGWGKDWRLEKKSPWFIIGVECVIIRRSMWCLPSLNCAENHRGRRYR